MIFTWEKSKAGNHEMFVTVDLCCEIPLSACELYIKK